MPNPVVHWEIQSMMPEKLQEFYAKLFDWHVDANNPMELRDDRQPHRGRNQGRIGPTAGPSNLVTFMSKGMTSRLSSTMRRSWVVRR